MSLKPAAKSPDFVAQEICWRNVNLHHHHLLIATNDRLVGNELDFVNGAAGGQDRSYEDCEPAW